jgi:hypothetical protein
MPRPLAAPAPPCRSQAAPPVLTRSWPTQPCRRPDRRLVRLPRRDPSFAGISAAFGFVRLFRIRCGAAGNGPRNRLRFLNHRRELLNACAEALRHAGVRSFEGRNAGVERALGAALARIGRRAGFLWGIMISDSPAFSAGLGFVQPFEQCRFARAGTDRTAVPRGHGSGRREQQRSVNPGPLTLFSGGPCDRGNLCRPPAGAGRRRPGGRGRDAGQPAPVAGA